MFPFFGELLLSLKDIAPNYSKLANALFAHAVIDSNTRPFKNEKKA